MKKIIVTGLAALTALSISGCGKNEVSLISDRIELELGTKPDTEVETYVNMKEKDAAEVSLDFSEVNFMKVGTYPANVICGDEKLPFEVVVKDTTAPAVEVEGNIVAAVNEPLSVKDIIASVTELSGEVHVSFQEPEPAGEDITEGSEAVSGTETVEMPQPEDASEEDSFTLDDVTFNNAYVTYDRTGEYENILTVADASGNRAEIPVHIVVGDAPVIEGVEDITVTAGADSVDYLEGIRATDSSGTDITSRITCNADIVDLSKEGTYTITYAVSDANGFEAVESAEVTVQKEDGKTAGTAKKKDTGKTDTSATGNSSRKTDASGTEKKAGTTGTTDNTSSGDAGSKPASDTGKGSSGGQTPAPTPTKPDTGNGSSGSGGQTPVPTPSTPDTGNGGSGNGNSSNGGQKQEPTPAPAPSPTPSTPDAGNGGNGQISDENQQRQDQIENGGFEDFDPETNPPVDDFHGGDSTWN